jgi:hypothetical protein
MESPGKSRNSLGAKHTGTGEGDGGWALMLDPDGTEFFVQGPVAGLWGLSNNGTASGDSGWKTAGLPPLAVRMWVAGSVG